MSDIGVIDTRRTASIGSSDPLFPRQALATKLTGSLLARVVPVWESGDPLQADAGGKITATVLVQGVAKSGMACHCVHRLTRTLVGAGVSDENGQVVFKNLNRSSDDYYVVAFSEQDYNAMIFDKLTPV